MNFLSTDLDKIYQFLEHDFFCKKYSGSFHFLPDELCNWAIQSRFLINTHEIKDWGLFEAGAIEYTENDFFSLMLKEDKLSSNDLIFISDETLKEKRCFEINAKDFYAFVVYYEERYNESFFQPLDFIIILKDIMKIKIIHHEGKLILIERHGWKPI
jgi:hypothetical protein